MFEFLLQFASATYSIVPIIATVTFLFSLVLIGSILFRERLSIRNILFIAMQADAALLALFELLFVSSRDAAEAAYWLKWFWVGAFFISPFYLHMVYAIRGKWSLAILLAYLTDILAFAILFFDIVPIGVVRRSWGWQANYGVTMFLLLMLIVVHQVYGMGQLLLHYQRHKETRLNYRLFLFFLGPFLAVLIGVPTVIYFPFIKFPFPQFASLCLLVSTTILYYDMFYLKPELKFG